MNFDAKKHRFASVRMSNGGGTRDVKLDLNVTKDGMLDIAMNLFFPNGKSPLGNKDAFDCKLGSFSGEEILSEQQGFTLGSYCEVNKLSHVRVYLLTKKIDPLKRLLEGINSAQSDDSDCIDEVLDVTESKRNKIDNTSSFSISRPASISETSTTHTADAMVLADLQYNLVKYNRFFCSILSFNNRKK